MPKEKPLELVRIPLSQIKPDPKNAKDHDVGLIIESFKRFGYIAAMVVSDDTLLAGHGRRKALLAMKADGQTPPINVEAEGDEWMVLVEDVARKFSKREATAYRLVDNRATEQGGYYEPQLIENLIDLNANGGLVGTGYDGDDLDKLIEITGYDIDSEEGFGGIPSGPKSEYRQMAFMLHEEQFKIVDQAIRAARESLPKSELDLNSNRNGSALSVVCRQFITGKPE